MKPLKRIFSSILLLVAIGFLCHSCGVYSFTGTSVAGDLKTVSIQVFQNISGGGPPNLSQTFTEKLKDRYQQNTKLTLVREDGDLQLSGNIVGYEIMPVAAQQNQTAALTRLTIRVEVEFVNEKNEEQNFKTVFSFFEDFAQNQTLNQVEIGLVDRITNQIVLDIFNRTLSDW